MKVVLNISRFNPEVDQQRYFQEFSVSVEGHHTVLDAMLQAWRQEPGLSFRRSCRSTICGSCAVSINGTPGLACQTLIRDAAGADGRVILEPLPHFRQLKDLVVDLEPFFESLKAVLPWVVTREDYSGRMAPEVSRQLEVPATCILCGVCDAAMDAPGEAAPAALVKGLRLTLDPRDALGEHRLALMKVPPDILKLFIKNLPDRCPKGIAVQGIKL
ncbi:succinate dehydrogenase/fumarate reductase iron-sulfur subunit [Pelotomaculum propionicicum]|uniref:Succinate dehydrogenase iron-sulfur subunit n=1 Tax=Pelotomaculum propionicicum TaxID=258475 RepID=A0A4Y7RVG7_9FIRM|nr:2Fe-2S iron-sulfur cluster-binding protein [Pelotomaculum propionicicum]NLI12037.1 2Fe-2S iron-sulfur cluster binding domain-containing protein [Peptococcaceae bacterium]TEB12994.1 Succinate dehydrogenase iron-sulfur subunit [Pelotomaculum propionicicum]